MRQSEKFTIKSIEERLEIIQTDLQYMKKGNLSAKEKDLIIWSSAKINDVTRVLNTLKGN